MSTELIGEGFKMMIVGMGMVFVFLVVMNFMMRIMGKVLEPYKNLLAAPAPAAKKAAAPAVDPAAVAAAVAAFRASGK